MSKRKLSNNNPRLEIDLLPLANEIYSEEVPQFRSALRQVLTQSDVKNTFASQIIKEIKDRTLSGKDKSNYKLHAYSKPYMKSIIFKIYGKSPRPVNLKLTGDMLSSISSKPLPGTKVEIYFEDELQAAKAHGHITGGGYNNNLPVRDFFDISKKDQLSILKDTLENIGQLQDIEEITKQFAEGLQYVTTEEHATLGMEVDTEYLEEVGLI